MTAVLGARDLRATLEYAESTLEVRDIPDVQRILLAGVSRLVGCEAVTLTHLDLRTQREVAVFWPPSRPEPRLIERYAPLGGTHPLRGPIAHGVRREGHGRLAPLRISDVLSRRQWHATPLYRESHAGTDDQMCLVLGARDTAVHAVTLGRSGRSFSERERALLAGCRGHLSAGLRRARRDGHSALQIAPAVALVAAADAPGLVQPAEPARSPTHGHSTAMPGAELSRRELEVLGLVAQGLTDAQAARRLGLSPATVSKHLTRVYGRLGVANRAAAVRWLLESGRDPART